MKTAKGVTFLAVLVFLGPIFSVCAQPNVPKETIPSDISGDLKTQIERLYSEDPTERAYATVALGKIGNRAAPAVPFLIGLLGDVAALKRDETLRYGDNSLSLLPLDTNPAREAAKALSLIGEPATEPLVTALKHDDSDVRENAAYALGQIRDSRAAGPLVAVLKDKDEDVVKEAIVALGEIKDPLAVDPLVTILENRESRFRSDAAKALGKIKDVRVIRALITALKDQEESVRNGVAVGLGNLRDPVAVEPLIDVFLKDAKVRWNVAWALGEIGEASVEPLLSALKNDDPDVRGWAAWALGKVKAPRTIAYLLPLLGDKNAKVRENTSDALGKMGKSALYPLLRSMQEDDSNVQAAAASALGFIEDRRAVPLLINALKRGNPDVQRNVMWALWKITGMGFEKDTEKWLRWWEQNKKGWESSR